MILSRAFKERKRLSDYVNKLRNDLRSAYTSHPTNDDSSCNNKPYLVDGKGVDALYKEYEELIEILIEINSTIDATNATAIPISNGAVVSGRRLLNIITAYKAAADVSNRLAKAVEGFNPVVKNYDPRAFNEQTQQQGAYVNVNWELDVKTEFDAKNKDMKIAIRKMEALLDEFNAKAIVTLSPRIEEFLDSAYDC